MDGRVLETKTRRYDIDWLRIAAVLLLIPFHTARVFNVGEQFYAKNEQLSAALQRFIVFVGPWHMSLLFFLAGAASWFALGFRAAGATPASGSSASWCRSSSAWSSSSRRRPTSACSPTPTRTAPGGASTRTSGRTGRDPTSYAGPWTPGHLWFILFLFVYSLLALGLFLWLRRGGGAALIDWFAAPAASRAWSSCCPRCAPAGRAGAGAHGRPQRPDPGRLLPPLRARLRAWWPTSASPPPSTGSGGGCWRWASPPWRCGPRSGRASGAGPTPAGRTRSSTGSMYEFGVWMMIVGLLGLFHRYANRRGRRLRLRDRGRLPVLHPAPDGDRAARLRRRAVGRGHPAEVHGHRRRRRSR